MEGRYVEFYHISSAMASSMIKFFRHIVCCVRQNHKLLRREYATRESRRTTAYEQRKREPDYTIYLS